MLMMVRLLLCFSESQIRFPYIVQYLHVFKSWCGTLFLCVTHKKLHFLHCTYSLKTQLSWVWLYSIKILFKSFISFKKHRSKKDAMLLLCYYCNRRIFKIIIYQIYRQHLLCTGLIHALLIWYKSEQLFSFFFSKYEIVMNQG